MKINGMTVVMVNKGGDSKTGMLPETITKAQIVKLLGKPNVEDDPDKVKNSWGFTLDGVRCGIWDYHGSKWSTFGPIEKIERLFEKPHILDDKNLPTTKLETIDITPSWSGILEVLLALYENGNEEGRTSAKKELHKMASIADLYVKDHA